MRSNPRSLVDAFVLEAHPAVRMGYLNALQVGSIEQARQVLDDSAARLDQHPDLTALAGRAALMTRDTDALGNVLADGQGYALSHLMRECVHTFDQDQVANLLRVVLENGSESSAALAISEFGVATLANSTTRALLFETLSHPVLGANAALALSRDPSEDTRKMLGELAAQDDSLVAARARSALSIRAPEDMRQQP